MKKLLSIGILTVCALAISEHQAQAWVNSRFSIGLNWHHQSANTSYLWGLWRNGQIPGPEAFGPGPGGPGGGGGGFPFLGAGLQNGAPQQGGAPIGYQQNGYQPGMQQGAFQPTMQPRFQPGTGYYPQWTPQQLPANMAGDSTAPPIHNAAYQSGYNPYYSVSYQQNSQNYGFYVPNGYYYNPYYYEAPYYWYGAR